jgi:hypothetical protein
MSTLSPAFFSLSHDPFTKEVSDADLWLPPSKQGQVEQLVDTLQARHSALLVGEPGVGKTCVLRALRQQLSTDRFRLTYCHNATLGRRDFYRQLCLALGLSPKATAAAVFYSVTGHVQDRLRSPPPRLPAGRGPPAALGRAGAPAHIVQLRMGQPGPCSVSSSSACPSWRTGSY